MKKALLISILIVALSAVTVFAAPVNNLHEGQTALGIQDQSVYIEHKFSNNLTLGLQENDIYGQFNLNKNFRILAGSKDYDNNSEFYGGLALSTTLDSNVDGYASLVAGNGFSEMQLGANINVSQDFDININYRSLMPEAGHDSNRTSVGATFKF